MNSLGRIEVFLEVAKHQSFAKAAKIMGITGPAASKQIMALEEELGVKLLHRTTRLVTLTDEGSHYYERARLAIEELKDAALQIQDQKASPTGTLRINAPVTFGQLHLLSVFSGFAKKYPELTLDVSLDDRMVDVIADGFDVVIRVGAPDDSSLISKHLADCPVYAVASPDYLKKHGTPVTPQDLKNHRMISYAYLGGAVEWKYKDKQGKTGAVRHVTAFRANNAELMLQAALDGVGIAILPLFCISVPMQAGNLVQLLADYETIPPRQVLALMPPNRYRAAKVKLFLDWLTQACKAMPLTLQPQAKKTARRQ